MAFIEKTIGYIIAFFIIIAVLAKCKGEDFSRFTSQADCRVLSVEVVPDTFIINGNFDFGYAVKAVVRNAGKRGEVTIEAYLSSSEGNLKRTQSLVFDANQQSTLQYQFSEPTLNASGVQARVYCSPNKAGGK